MCNNQTHLEHKVALWVEPQRVEFGHLRVGPHASLFICSQVDMAPKRLFGLIFVDVEIEESTVYNSRLGSPRLGSVIPGWVPPGWVIYNILFGHKHPLQLRLYIERALRGCLALAPSAAASLH